MVELLLAVIALVLAFFVVVKEKFIGMLAWNNLPYSYGVARIHRECRENCYTNYRWMTNRNADELMACLRRCRLR